MKKNSYKYLFSIYKKDTEQGVYQQIFMEYPNSTIIKTITNSDDLYADIFIERS